jgi:hypothetical protein
MDARRFDGISRAVGTGSPRRQVLRLLAGGALAGAGLVRLRADAGAISGKDCCEKRGEDYRLAKRDCEKRRRGRLSGGFSCDPRTCDPNVEIAYLCLLP